MGREAYLNLLSLGRQCFEPQSSSTTSNRTEGQQASQNSRNQVDREGEQADQGDNNEREESTEVDVAAPAQPHHTNNSHSRHSQPQLDSQRAFRKAQNEVLTIVGIHLHKPNQDGSLYSPSQTERENDMGLVLGTLDLVTLYFMTWPLISIRNELQTFRRLEDMNYIDILTVAFSKRRALEWFAGMPSHIVFQIANIFRDYGQSVLFRWLKKKTFFRDKATGKPRKRLVSFLYKFSSISLDLLFFPIYRHSVLQSLHMIPAAPFFPHYTAFSPIPTGLLALPFIEIVRFFLSPSTYVNSPFLWYLVQQKIAFRVHIKFLNIFSRLLPRPDKYEEVKASGGYIVGDSNYSEITGSDDGDNDGTVRGDEVARINGGRDDGSGGTTQTFTATVQLHPLSDADDTTPRGRRPTNASDISVPASEGGAGGRGGGGEGGAGDGLNELSGHISEIEVQVTASTARDHAQGESSQQNTANASVPVQQERHYRSTQLASHPTDVIASHVADAVATSLTIGLESMVMRTTALSYLRTNLSRPIPTTNMVFLLAQRANSSRAVVPWRSLGLYGVYKPLETGKNWGPIGRALALEWGVTWALFEAAYWVTTWVAVKWFGYQ